MVTPALPVLLLLLQPMLLLLLLARLEGHVLGEQQQRPLTGGEGLGQGDLRPVASGARGDPWAGLGREVGVVVGVVGVVARLDGGQVVRPVRREVEIVLGGGGREIVILYIYIYIIILMMSVRKSERQKERKKDR